MNEKTEESRQDLPSKKYFTSSIEQKFFEWYYKLFSIDEIEKKPVLQWTFGALLLTYLVTFEAYARSGIVSVANYLHNSFVCLPYFQSCGEYFFLENLPYGYTQPLFYMIFFGLMILIVYWMYRRDWLLAHIGLLVLLVWKFLMVFVFSYEAGGNYNYFDVILTAVLLFVANKEFFLRVTFVMLYFLASTLKFEPGWILGTYFTAMEIGLPIFPDQLAPLVTSTVILMQVVGSWFLLSSNPVRQRLALTFFILFHLYSGILVHYRYLITALPILLILFAVHNRPVSVPLNKKSITGWVILFILLCWQLFPYSIGGDQRMTMEGYRFGLYMFEANHQCITESTMWLKDGTTQSKRKHSFSARYRCDPYKYWFQMKQVCLRFDSVDRISWTFDHSINGGPFYRIVDTENLCNLEYKAFSRNTWIKKVSDDPEIIGYPVKNVYK